MNLTDKILGVFGAIIVGIATVVVFLLAIISLVAQIALALAVVVGIPALIFLGILKLLP